MPLLLVADIGGSKTMIKLYQTDGKEVRTYVGVGVGSATDSDEDIPALREILNPLVNLGEISTIAVNLGGRNKGQVSAIFRNIFPNAELIVFREAEGTAALALAEIYDASVILFAGTGSIAIAHSEEKTYIAGGWGANIGDDGSGYSIGLEAVRVSLRELDNSEPLSKLAKAITGLDEQPNMYNASDCCDLRDRVRNFMSPLDRRGIAHKAKTVSDIADKGCPVAKSIFSNVGRELGQLVSNAWSKVNGKNVRNIVVTGGLIHSRRHWQSEFETYVKTKISADRFYYIQDGIMIGTYEIAKKIYFKER